MTWGKYSKGQGLTIREVQQKDPGYFQNMMSWKNIVLELYPDMKAALAKEGLLERLLKYRPKLMLDKAKRVLENVGAENSQEEGHIVTVHPEITRLRNLQQIEASQVLYASAKGAVVVVMGSWHEARQEKANKKKKQGATRPQR